MKATGIVGLGLWLPLALLPAACSPRRPAARAPAAPQTPFGKVEGIDPRRWLGSDSERASAAGAADSQLIAVDAASSGDRVSGVVSVPEADCVLAIARGSANIEDLDLFAFGDDGALLGADERPDKSPAVMVCPPHPARLFLSARVSSGLGLVAIGAQRVAVKDARRVGERLNARGRPGEERGQAETWAGLDGKIARRRRALGGEWQVVRKVAIPAEQLLPTRVSAQVEADRCMDVLVVPSDEISHLDVALLDGEGRTIGRARGSGRDRASIVCSPTRAPITVEIQPQSGRGIAAVVLSSSTGPARDLLDADPLALGLGPVLPLAEAEQRLAEDLAPLGYKSVETVMRGDLPIGRRKSVPLDLRGGCTRIDVLAGTPLLGVEAWLWSSDGALEARADGSAGTTLFACGPPRKSRLDLEAVSQPGPFAVALRREHETPRVLEAHGLAASRLLGRMSERGVLRSAHEAGAPESIGLEGLRREQRGFKVPVGRCAELTVALGPGASGADLRILDASDAQELALVRGTHAASARVCALGRPGPLEIMVELSVGTGKTDALYATRLLTPQR